MFSCVDVWVASRPCPSQMCNHEPVWYSGEDTQLGIGILGFYSHLFSWPTVWCGTIPFTSVSPSTLCYLVCLNCKHFRAGIVSHYGFVQCLHNGTPISNRTSKCYYSTNNDLTSDVYPSHSSCCWWHFMYAIGTVLFPVHVEVSFKIDQGYVLLMQFA